MADVVEPLAGHLALLDAVVRDVTKRVDGGELKPTVADGIKAAEVLGRAEESKDRHFDYQAYDIAVGVLTETVRGMLTMEQFSEFQHRVARDPILKALIAKQQSQERAALAS